MEPDWESYERRWRDAEEEIEADQERRNAEAEEELLAQEAARREWEVFVEDAERDRRRLVEPDWESYGSRYEEADGEYRRRLEESHRQRDERRERMRRAEEDYLRRETERAERIRQQREEAERQRAEEQGHLSCANCGRSGREVEMRRSPYPVDEYGDTVEDDYVEHYGCGIHYFCPEHWSHVRRCEECDGSMSLDPSYSGGRPEYSCHDCGAVSVPCPNCGRYAPYGSLRNAILVGGRGATQMCSACWQNTFQCTSCDLRDVRSLGALRSRECRDCRRRTEERRATRDVRYDGRSVTSSGRASVPFSAEFEVVFDGETPFRIGGYSGTGNADPPFYGGWSSRSDGSLPGGRSAELVSPGAPFLRGPGGVAEALSTITKLKTAFNIPAKVDAQCGGHITLSADDEEARLQAMRLFTIMEEAAFASTGGWKRYNHQHYCTPVKARGYDRLANEFDPASYSNKYTALHDKARYGCLEFRYPPGTLSHTQFVLNLGLCQLVVRMAKTLDNDTIQTLINQTRPHYYGSRIGEPRGGFPGWHLFTIYGLYLMSKQGWKRGGSFTGVPYALDRSGPIVVRDVAREMEDTVELPTGDQLYSRLVRQVKGFYRRAGREEGSGYTEEQAEPWMEASVSVLEGELNDDAQAALDTLTGGEQLEIPVVSRVPARIR